MSHSIFHARLIYGVELAISVKANFGAAKVMPELELQRLMRGLKV